MDSFKTLRQYCHFSSVASVLLETCEESAICLNHFCGLQNFFQLRLKESLKCTCYYKFQIVKLFKCSFNRLMTVHNLFGHIN